ncbi:MAG: hypothetical protein A3I39_01120 [Candidatus Yanofskybacteria bacterium RIFCSPLOWO2_02_FULL_47_9b]|uniref:Uncharacterized protein n=1 Tax=Candidatus Yanofskybacteria bacterium RIFCSPLOWO2_02_FULL_47_9b TaxID=1802708 RepID=A0A1F8HA18_9BACT|nr:MAG: hypothetical protein A3I39_01120 [Candidatus Yanofskybacteria bacterium RIFCSPLOWO2_02_FULL_47_9b]
METQTEQQLTKKERKEFRRQEKLETQETAIVERRKRHTINWAIGISAVILPIGGLIWYSATRPPIPESDIVSRDAFHWHPELAIYVKGEKQDIPANIGIGAVHQPIHTHTDDNRQGVVHMEFQGLALKQDVTLGQFFKNWGKDIRSFGANMKMTVNGQENLEYENYLMQDKDKIELRYE